MKEIGKHKNDFLIGFSIVFFGCLLLIIPMHMYNSPLRDIVISDTFGKFAGIIYIAAVLFILIFTHRKSIAFGMIIGLIAYLIVAIILLIMFPSLA